MLPETLRYPALGNAGPPASSAPERSPAPGFPLLLPSSESQAKEEEAAGARRIAELEAQLAGVKAQLPLTAERSRLEGEEAGLRKAGEEFAQALSQSRAAVAASLEAFDRERLNYFRRVEAEVVRLALAIARKILHREAQMDPMLLSGTVRAALDRLEESGSVVLRLPVGEGDGWKRALGNLPEGKRPALLEDRRLKPGDCVIESQMGTIELSVDAQLKEITRGFFDLMDQRSSVEESAGAGERGGQ